MHKDQASKKYDSDFPAICAGNGKTVEGIRKMEENAKINASKPNLFKKLVWNSDSVTNSHQQFPASTSERMVSTRVNAKIAAARNNVSAKPTNPLTQSHETVNEATPKIQNPPTSNKTNHKKALVIPNRSNYLTGKQASDPNKMASPPLPDDEKDKAKTWRRGLENLMNDKCGPKLELWMRGRMGTQPTSDIDVFAFLEKIIKETKKDAKFFPKCDQKEALIALCWFQSGLNSASNGLLRYILNRMAYYLSAIIIVFGEGMVNDPEMVKKAKKMLGDYGLTFTSTFPYCKDFVDM